MCLDLFIVARTPLMVTFATSFVCMTSYITIASDVLACAMRVAPCTVLDARCATGDDDDDEGDNYLTGT